jgi:hypothetical protein
MAGADSADQTDGGPSPADGGRRRPAPNSPWATLNDSDLLGFHILDSAVGPTGAYRADIGNAILSLDGTTLSLGDLSLFGGPGGALGSLPARRQSIPPRERR